MFILAGSDNAVSFTDDTSPNTLKTKKRNVSLNAQVRKENSLDWYYELLFLCRNVKGELKSKQVIDIYKSIPQIKRAKLWETLKEVQINITDPLPYQINVNKIVNKLMNRNDAIEMIRQRAITKDQRAIKALEMLNNQTAESILFDAPSRNLSWKLHFAKRFPGYGYGLFRFMGNDIEPPDRKIDLSKLKSNKTGSIVRAATEWTAKSASAFSDAIDACFSKPYFFDHPALNPVYRALRKAHAFDAGNEKYIDLMEDERKQIRREIFDYSYWDDYWDKMYPMAPLEGNLDSRKSYFIQAADLAGGIASHLYEQGGIFTVAQNFEYVLFNGKRISQDEAFDTMKQWQELGYFN